MSRDQAALAPDLDQACASWGHALPLLLELEQTPQDPLWHAEGDVATHTRMVIEQAHEACREHADALGLDATQRRLVLWGALLHDIAKPLTTTRQLRDGLERVIAPRHAQRGADWLAWRLLELELPHDLILPLLELVRDHHEPKFLVIKDAPAGAYRRLMRRTSMRALYLLELADMRGRRCDDQREQIDHIELFRLMAEEHEAFDQPAQTLSFCAHIAWALRGLPLTQLERACVEGLWSWDQGLIHSPEEAVARARNTLDRDGQVTLLCGPSGSGKSTWLARHAHDAQIISMDALRAKLGARVEDQRHNSHVFAAARELLLDALRAQRPVIWDATSLRRDQRQAILETGRRYGAHTSLMVFHVAPSRYAARNRARPRQVPPHVLERQLDQAQWPDRDEAHRVCVWDDQGQLVWDTRQQLGLLT